MRITIIISIFIILGVAVGLWLAVHGQSEILSKVVTVCKTVDKKVLVERINISEVAWLEIPKILTTKKCQEIEVHYKESCSTYTGCKEIVVDKKVLKEWFENSTKLSEPLRIRVSLEKYKEIWVKENPWLARYVKKWIVRSVTTQTIAERAKDGLRRARWIAFEIPVPLGAEKYVRYPYMSNDTYIRYVIVPAIRVLAKYFNMTNPAEILRIGLAFRPYEYNVGNAYTGLWEYFIGYGGVCWQYARVGVAIAHYLGYRAVAIVLENHEVSYVCEPWWYNYSIPEYYFYIEDKALIYLRNGTVLKCALYQDTGVEGLWLKRPRCIEVYKGYGRFVTIVPERIVLIGIGGSRTYTLRR